MIRKNPDGSITVGIIDDEPIEVKPLEVKPIEETPKESLDNIEPKADEAPKKRGRKKK